jgi:hypothetical protein
MGDEARAPGVGFVGVSTVTTVSDLTETGTFGATVAFQP